MEGCSESDGEEYASEDSRASDEYLDGLEDIDPPSDSRDIEYHNRVSFQVITPEKMEEEQMVSLSKVMEVWGVKKYQARALLTIFCWDIDRLQEALVDKGQDTVFSKAGLIQASSTASQVGEGSDKDRDADVTCGICTCDYKRNECSAMDCGHLFCNSCWTQYFKVQVEEGKSRLLTCMGYKCGIVCDENKVVELLRSSEETDVAGKLQARMMDAYVEDNPQMRWCTSTPHCGNAVSVSGGGDCLGASGGSGSGGGGGLGPSPPLGEPVCLCGHSFCFRCAHPAHSPASCKMNEMWTKKCSDDSKTAGWLSVHTKTCPKCRKAVEKNGGCNHVTCRCGQSFCWVCGVATGRAHTWSNIEGHVCSRFLEDDTQATEEHNLKRFFHYHQRWNANLQSRKLEKQKLDAMQEAREQEELEEYSSGNGLGDVNWLFEGIKQLSVARNCHAYSFVFAYYTFGDLFKDVQICKKQELINKNLFEDKQESLQDAIERLAENVERGLSGSNDVKLEVLNLTTYVDVCCAHLYDVVHNDLLRSLPRELREIHATSHYSARCTSHVNLTRTRSPSSSPSPPPPSLSPGGEREDSSHVPQASDPQPSLTSSRANRKRNRSQRSVHWEEGIIDLTQDED